MRVTNATSEGANFYKKNGFDVCPVSKDLVCDLNKACAVTATARPSRAAFFPQDDAKSITSCSITSITRTSITTTRTAPTATSYLSRSPTVTVTRNDVSVAESRKRGR